uniref:polynucleotide adenylyltransferase n=1 Tax=Bursaphelenchus xylophilus TaxID=6326 RepID=A0A1I7SFU2_BURXY
MGKKEHASDEVSLSLLLWLRTDSEGRDLAADIRGVICEFPRVNSPPHSGEKINLTNQFLQVERLRTVLTEEVEIHGKENFPTLRITLHKLISHVRRKLLDRQLALKHVKLNGGAASYVLSMDEFVYSDLDLIFPIDLSQEGDFDKVRCAVFDALIELMPASTNKQMMCVDTLKDIYIRKMVKVSDGDRWSLFSLHNNYGRCIELKFVDKMRRQFEFSVDSFQITLDSVLDAAEQNQLEEKKLPKSLVVPAESMFGNFHAAQQHLQKRLIDTRNPEEIRGGGLLKYCHLLCKGYTATQNCREMEKYMCSRFFIDFSDINMQEIKLRQYLDNHFGTEDEQKFQYLQILNRVIKESTVCLMGHERRSTQAMIERLRQQISYSCFYQGQDGGYYEHTPRQVLLYLPQNSNHWIRVV